MRINIATAISHVVEKYNHAERWQASAVEEKRALEDLLPSGSGIDCGTKISLSDSKPGRLVLYVGFHHMDEHGSYDGWTYHQVIVTPCFGGIEVRVTGRNRNGIKAYLAEIYHHALTNEVETRYENGALSYTLATKSIA